MNRPAVEELTHAAAYLGLRGGYTGFYEGVFDLRETLGIPKTLGAMGVTAEKLDDLTAMALEDPTMASNPVPMTAESTWKLLEACL